MLSDIVFYSPIIFFMFFRSGRFSKLTYFFQHKDFQDEYYLLFKRLYDIADLLSTSLFS